MRGYELLLLGGFIGLLSLLPPGPVNVTLVEVGAAHGRRNGVRAGLGVASGEALLAAAAVALIAAGANLPGVVFTSVQLVSGLTLAMMGLALIAKPHVGAELAVRLSRPFTSMFAISVLTPSVFGAWLALLAAMPFADNSRELSIFCAGAIIASVLWHAFLGGAAGTIAPLLRPVVRIVVTRAGGVAMTTFGLWSVLA